MRADFILELLDPFFDFVCMAGIQTVFLYPLVADLAHLVYQPLASFPIQILHIFFYFYFLFQCRVLIYSALAFLDVPIDFVLLLEGYLGLYKEQLIGVEDFIIF